MLQNTTLTSNPASKSGFPSEIESQIQSEIPHQNSRESSFLSTLRNEDTVSSLGFHSLKKVQD